MKTTQVKSNKKTWTTEEDGELLELVTQYGLAGSWPTIAQYMDNRSGKQCRERYVNQLDPSIKKSMWTHEEDVILKKMHRQVGTKWSKIMAYLPGRSDNAIKNRFHIISRENYFQHNLAVTNHVKASGYVPDSFSVRMEQFRTARDILTRKINALVLQQEGHGDDSHALCVDTDEETSTSDGSIYSDLSA